MKTKALVATLLIAAAANAHARFAWPYPPKAVSPDEIGHWVGINGNAWPDNAEPELTFTKQMALKNRRTTPQALAEKFKFPKTSVFECLRKVA